jgi:hypothetical protein
MFELPELPECPYHGHDPSKPLAGCRICWLRFYIPFEYGPKLRQIEFAINEYISLTETGKRLIALEAEGFETKKFPSKATKVLFALPSGERVVGRFIDDGMDGLYPVKDNADQSPVGPWSGWRYE